jgi:hypothetical protein
MNKFKNIVKNILEKELWASECTIIPLIQITNEKGQIVWNADTEVNVKCIKKETQKMTADSKFVFLTEFIFSAISLEGILLDKKHLKIRYNNKEYVVEDILTMGTLNNEDALVKMVVRR